MSGDLARASQPLASTLTDRIRAAVAGIAERVADLRALVAEADDTGEWRRLGYASLRDYLADVLEPVRGLDRGQRADLARVLADGGMTTREIAPIVGASFATVARDLRPDPVSDDTSGPLVLDLDALAAEHVESTDAELSAMLSGVWAAMLGGAVTRVQPPAERPLPNPTTLTDAVALVRLSGVLGVLMSLDHLHAVFVAAVWHAAGRATLREMPGGVPEAIRRTLAEDTPSAERWQRLAAARLLAPLDTLTLDADPMLCRDPLYVAEVWHGSLGERIRIAESRTER